MHFSGGINRPPYETADGYLQTTEGCSITPASYAHREEITIHKAAKKAFHELGVKRIPKVKDLNAEYARLMAEKKQTFAEYRKARDEVKKYL